MRESIDKQIPRYKDLIVPTFQALKALGGSGNNDDILVQIIADLCLSNEVVDAPHKGSTSLTELAYQAAWARTYLKNYGIISNTARSVWVINPDYAHSDTVDAKKIIATVTKQNSDKRKAKVQELEALIQEKNDTKEILTNFITKLEDLTGEQTEFREELWGGLVDHIRIDEKSSLVVFRGGIEITI